MQLCHAELQCGLSLRWSSQGRAGQMEVLETLASPGLAGSFSGRGVAKPNSLTPRCASQSQGPSAAPADSRWGAQRPAVFPPPPSTPKAAKPRSREGPLGSKTAGKAAPALQAGRVAAVEAASFGKVLEGVAQDRKARGGGESPNGQEPSNAAPQRRTSRTSKPEFVGRHGRRTSAVRETASSLAEMWKQEDFSDVLALPQIALSTPETLLLPDTRTASASSGRPGQRSSEAREPLRDLGAYAKESPMWTTLAPTSLPPIKTWGGMRPLNDSESERQGPPRTGDLFFTQASLGSSLRQSEGPGLGGSDAESLRETPGASSAEGNWGQAKMSSQPASPSISPEDVPFETTFDALAERFQEWWHHNTLDDMIDLGAITSSSGDEKAESRTGRSQGRSLKVAESSSPSPAVAAESGPASLPRKARQRRRKNQEIAGAAGKEPGLSALAVQGCDAESESHFLDRANEAASLSAIALASTGELERAEGFEKQGQGAAARRGRPRQSGRSAVATYRKSIPVTGKPDPQTAPFLQPQAGRKRATTRVQALGSSSEGSSDEDEWQWGAAEMDGELQQLAERIEQFMASQDLPYRMPTRKELRSGGDEGLNLEKAIGRMGGLYECSQLLGLPMGHQRRPKGYWQQTDNLKLQVRAFQHEHGLPLSVMPSRTLIEQKGRFDLARALEKWGGHAEVAQMLGLRARRVRPKGIHRPKARGQRDAATNTAKTEAKSEGGAGKAEEDPANASGAELEIQRPFKARLSSSTKKWFKMRVDTAAAEQGLEPASSGA